MVVVEYYEVVRIVCVVTSTERSSPHCGLNIDAYVLQRSACVRDVQWVVQLRVMHAGIVDKLVGCANGPCALLATRVSYGLGGRCVL